MSSANRHERDRARFPRALVMLTTACVMLGTACSVTSPRAAAPGVQVSSFSRAMLADGRVTRAEHERSLAATLACADRAGLKAQVARKSSRTSQLSVESGAYRPGESEAAYDKRTGNATDRCLHDYWEDVEDGWLRTTAPSEEERAHAVVRLSTCEVRQGERRLHNDADVKALQLRLGNRLKAQAPLVSPDDAVATRLDRQLTCMTVYQEAVADGQ